MVNFWLANYKGELAALGAALLWASASVVYGRLGEKIPPLELNLSKGAVAIALLLLTLLLRGDISQTTLAQLNPTTTTLLFLSGIVGIGFGDTAFFTAINNLGARRTLLLQTLAPPLAALLAMIFLRETLPQTTWLGIIITISGIAWVISDRAGATTTETHLLSGVTWGALAAAAQATGAVLSRAALATTNIDPLNSTLLRLMAGVFMLWLWTKGQKTPTSWNQFSPRLLLIVAVTAFFSTYLGIYCQQTSLKFAPAGIAQTLTATSPLFVIPIVVIWMGERVSLRALLGAIVSIAGVAVLFLR